MRKSRLLTVCIALFLAALLLSFSIATPILCRPFYYAHIGPLGLCARTGLTDGEIRQAYNEMLDYCLGGSEFSTGVLSFSESGKSHFTDVRGLFLLDLWVLGLSAAALVLSLLAARRFTLRPRPLLRRGPAFWAGAGLGGLFLIVGGLACLDFDKAFVVFHGLFFPGKSNWLFDPAVDQIINILPDTFFRNCAILILSILLLGCAALIVGDLLRGRKRKRS